MKATINEMDGGKGSSGAGLRATLPEKQDDAKRL